MPAVTDPADVRVLIPRARRALDGPHATSSAAVSNTLNDVEVTNIVADAIADIIFYSGGEFPSLEVTDRDGYYLAPSGWKTDPALSEPQISVVIAQAALNYFTTSLVTLKSSETIRNADEEWSWSISANALNERIKELRSMRDKAIDQLVSEGGALSVAWVNTLAVRDALTDNLIEPYLTGGALLASGQEFVQP